MEEDMNPTLNLIHNRRSIRRYADAPVTPQEKEAILQAAMRAPTAGNMMLYTIIEVEDQSLKDRLAVTCDNQPFIAKAPYVLLFLADYQRWMDIFDWSDAPRVCLEKNLQPRTPQEGDLMLACCDALIAAQTAVIAAESLGVSSCYIGDILENCDEHRAMFNLPRYTFPISLVCFGHPYVTRENPGLIRRFDQKFIVQQNHYSSLNTTDIPVLLEHASRQFPSLQPGEAAQQVAQGIYCRKFVSDFSVEMSRSVRKWMAIWNGEQD
jgi:FMN reductase (NADPH)/FMN reductase [NAD(P)H]